MGGYLDTRRNINIYGTTYGRPEIYNYNCERREHSRMQASGERSPALHRRPYGKRNVTKLKRTFERFRRTSFFFFFFFFFFLNFNKIHEIIDTMTRKIKSYTHKKQTKKIQKLKQTNVAKQNKNKTNKHGRKSQGMPSTDGARVGSRRIHKVALPLHRRMAQR